MTGCVTTRAQIELPPMPEREQIETPHTLEEIVRTMLYYEILVEQWEVWGKTVENSLQKN